MHVRVHVWLYIYTMHTYTKYINLQINKDKDIYASYDTSQHKHFSNAFISFFFLVESIDHTLFDPFFFFWITTPKRWSNKKKKSNTDIYKNKIKKYVTF